ncbi:MAG: hypothetical protein IID41_06865 [Planctomycetes bacterium]|nr:hypothetical protein [Planctomycetota bacterium]
MEVTIKKIESADAGYGFSGGENTRRCATYGVFAGERLVGKIAGSPGYMTSNEWIVEDHDITNDNGSPRRLSYHSTLKAAKASATRIFGKRPTPLIDTFA